MPRPALSLISAVARNGAIGRDNALLWSDPEDLRHFRRVTLGHPVIMGRKTWDSLPPRFRPLPGRRNLVVTRRSGWSAPGAETAASLDAALALLDGTPRAFVIGGGQLYALALPQADELVLTEIDADFVGDTFFPEFDRRQFQERSREAHRDAHGTAYSFVHYSKDSSHV
jgi:dihydrofolate reductase